MSNNMTDQERFQITMSLLEAIRDREAEGQLIIKFDTLIGVLFDTCSPSVTRRMHVSEFLTWCEVTKSHAFAMSRYGPGKNDVEVPVSDSGLD